ncbi:hypothetical protein RTBOTA2_002271 [Rhodotorula toruloides]|nr:hypothetical protein RTBOTA2_002271 [Rhodotorula toruloides]
MRSAVLNVSLPLTSSRSSAQLLALDARFLHHPSAKSERATTLRLTPSPPHPPACLKALSRDHLRRLASPSYYLLRGGTLARRKSDVQASVPFRNGLLRIES